MDFFENLNFDVVNKKLEGLRASEKSRSNDDPITLQIDCELYDFSLEEKSMTIAFPLIKKELNPNGTMMGGVTCTALDMTYGILVYCLMPEGGVIPPTITLTTNFINPVFYGDTLLVTAKIESWGKRVINMTAVGKSKNTGKTIVTSTSTYVSNLSFAPKINKPE